MSEPVQTFGPGALPTLEELTAVLRARRAHPLVPLPSPAEALAMLAAGEDLFGYLSKREKLLELATDEERGDPYRYGFDREYLPHWKEADEDLYRLVREGFLGQGPKAKGQYVAGGKRATKTERAARRVVRAAHTFGRGKLWCFQGSEKTSRAEQQQLVWKYLPAEIKALNGKKRYGFAKVNWSPDGGFTENILVLPNRTELYFLTYNQDPKEFQGWAIGAKVPRHEAMEAAKQGVFNVGAWMDEDCPMSWLETVDYRCATNEALWLWTFSTLAGITMAIKEVLGTPKTLKHRRAELLPAERLYVDDCPRGHVPYVQRPARQGVSVVYFHTDLNPFPPNYEVVKDLCREKPDSYILENAYGWSEDTISRSWPIFGSVHLVEPEDLPAEGTNYFLTDPAGARMWASIWFRVSPDGKHWIYRDWPDARRFGAWAVPEEQSGQAPDGLAGPAQRGRNYGYVQYKQAWCSEEAIQFLREWAALDPAGLDEALTRVHRDPQRRRVVLRWIENWREDGTPESALEDLKLAEEIFERQIDPRAGRNRQVSEKGGTCGIDELSKVHRHEKTGELLAPAMYFRPASGVERREGITAVSEMLWWDKQKPFDPIMNAPKLYVVRTCEQVRWALENYTDTGGEDGGCKDFADLLRYMAMGRFRYISPGMLKTTGTGSY